MKFVMFIIFVVVLLVTSINAKIQINTRDNGFTIKLNPKEILDDNFRYPGINIFLEPNSPKIKYLSYLFIAPEKINNKKINVKVALGRRIVEIKKLKSGDTKEGYSTKLTNDFHEPFYEIKYVKQLAGMYLYEIKIYPFSYKVINSKLSFNLFIDIDVTFSKKLSSYYKNIHFPQKNMLMNTIINLKDIKFKQKKINILNLSKNLETNFELSKADFISDTSLVDYLIITDEEFVDEAIKLCSYRLNNPNDLVHYPKFVTTKTIYGVYEDSHKDSYQPKAKSLQSAILRLKKTSDSLLTFVVLMGSGYTEVWSPGRKNYIPIFTKSLPVDPSNGESYLTSDDLMTINDGETPYPNTTFIGRIPARNIEDATNLVDKIIASEDFSKSKGDWQNNILLLADDDKQLGKPDPISTPHEKYLEDYVIPYIPNYVEKQRVYTNLYPLDNNGYKPTATNDMVSAINSGTFFSIYSGHGGETLISDERLFTVENITSLTNTKYPIFMFLSCNVGAFHMLEESLSEVLVNYKDYGSSLVLAATKETYATQNNIFGGRVIEAIYKNENRSIGEIVNWAKLGVTNSVALAYHIFGDPAHIVKLPIAIPLTNETTIYPFEKISTNTKIPIGVWNYNYKFFDALKYVKYITEVHKKTVKYTENGSMLYSNSSSVTSGVVSESFIAPKNIKVNDSTAGYNLYVENGVKDYIYSNYNFNSKSPQNYSGNKINNIDGPTIKFFQVNSVVIGVLKKETTSPLHNGDEVKLPAVIKVQLYDKDGIYLNGNYKSDAGYGGIPYSWDNKKSSYAYESYNKETGSFSLQLDSNCFIGGLHKLTVSSIDVQGNISKHELSITIVTPDSKKILSRIYTYPNPGKLPIKIVYQLLDKIYEGKILIYDSRGKLLKTFRILEENTRIGFNHITWDGTINNGLKLGKGFYIAQIMVYKDAEDKSNNIKESKKFKFFIE